MDKIRPEDHCASLPSPDLSAEAQERRRHRRYDAAVDVRYRELRPAGDVEPMQRGQTMNISNTGMFIKTNCFFRLGTMLELQVDILTPENELRELHMVGRVIWISMEDSLLGMGVEFKDIDEETQRSLLAHTYRGDLQFLGPDSSD